MLPGLTKGKCWGPGGAGGARKFCVSGRWKLGSDSKGVATSGRQLHLGSLKLCRAPGLGTVSASGAKGTWERSVSKAEEGSREGIM